MLKMILLTFATMSALNAFSDTLKPGRYVPLSGNAGFFRIHDVQTVTVGMNLKAIKVTFSNGYFSEGPVRYECSEIWRDLICQKNETVFVIHDSTHYMWHDKLYGNLAEFELKR